MADAASGVRVDYLPLFPKCQVQVRARRRAARHEDGSLRALDPGDSKMSSLPVLFFDFKLTNPDVAEKTVALAFMVPDPECGGGKPMIGRRPGGRRAPAIQAGRRRHALRDGPQ